MTTITRIRAVRLVAGCALVSTLALGSAAYAEGRRITYQGRLTSQTPIANVKAVRASIYESVTATASETRLWGEERHEITPDSDGNFVVVLGATDLDVSGGGAGGTAPDGIPDLDELQAAKPWFLQLTIELNTGELVPLTPRQRIYPAFHAVTAGQMDHDSITADMIRKDSVDSSTMADGSLLRENFANGILPADAVRAYSRNDLIPNYKPPWNGLPLDAESYDENNLHDTVTNNTRLTAKYPGVYLISGGLSWSNSTSATTQGLFIRVNGVQSIASGYNEAPSSVGSLAGVSTTYELQKDDYVELVAIASDLGSPTVRNVHFEMALLQHVATPAATPTFGVTPTPVPPCSNPKPTRVIGASNRDSCTRQSNDAAAISYDGNPDPKKVCITGITLTGNVGTACVNADNCFSGGLTSQGGGCVPCAEKYKNPACASLQPPYNGEIPSCNCSSYSSGDPLCCNHGAVINCTAYGWVEE